MRWKEPHPEYGFYEDANDRDDPEQLAQNDGFDRYVDAAIAYCDNIYPRISEGAADGKKRALRAFYKVKELLASDDNFSKYA